MDAWKRDLAGRAQECELDEARIVWDDTNEIGVVDGRFVIEAPDDGAPGLWVVEMMEDGTAISIGVVNSL